ncbi:MAG: polysaccharide deacetylase family protein [Prevotella sp.]|nr:polysaccharide deacetylase family protein [Prevotella sp.]
MKLFRHLFFWCSAVVLVASLLSTYPPRTNTVSSAPQTSAVANTRNLPILMYHQVSARKHGKYIVSVAQLESDFQAIVDAGYTPVFLHEVADWVNGQGTLPEKPIVITFDDGQYNNLYYVLPLAQKYGIKYVINPVTAYSEKSIHDHDTNNPRYSNLSWEAIKTAYDSGWVEFGNHTHNLHHTSPRYGVGKKPHESTDTYVQTLTTDITHAQELLTACGIPTPTIFAYPFGKYQSETKQIILDMGFNVLLTCNEHVNHITQGDPTCLHALGRFNRSGNTTTAQIMRKITAED